MNRKDFIKYGSLSSLALVAAKNALSNNIFQPLKTAYPLAITMWEFSWLERRWPGGSYEDWDKALEELTERGYNAVRIDAYPHLVAENPTKEWTLLPVWDQYDWGAPAKIKVQVQPSLTDFIAKCKQHKVKVGLSTWYRQDADNTRLKIDSPQKMADNWRKVLDIISEKGLLDNILYVDLCNEWPLDVWAPFFKAAHKGGDWTTGESREWMKTAAATLQEKYPQIPLTFSFMEYKENSLRNTPVPYLDLLEQHIWMASQNGDEFNNKIGITWDNFSSGDLQRLAEKSEPLYKNNKAYWNNLLVSFINRFAADASAARLPLITTECWSVINYKDYPMLQWDWVKDVCELGVKTAAATGQWVAIGTSNFCGPQFTGMWADVDWHKRLTKLIRSSGISHELMDKKIISRLV
jgi:hypothetical protein